MSSGDENGVGNRSLFELIGLTNVKKHRRGCSAKHFGFAGFDLGDLAFCLRQKVSEGRHGVPQVLGGTNDLPAQCENPT